ncbi:hypothetical protein [Cerasicoccus fimbriatus]|uniref:hypothetical protein n=1 Tax=Cerasicoccus fimbriatus TaxID=3014554 RepID=UPI0022B4CDA4|nr:hypothetical protein [Cerasicoccus sp. TK19100]
MHTPLPRWKAAIGALAGLCLGAPTYATIDVTGDQTICQSGNTITDTQVAINNTDIARVTGGDLTLTAGPSINLSDSGSYIQTGGNVDAAGEVQINRNVATGDVVFEIHGGKFNTAENTGVHLTMPYAANSNGGTTGTALVTGGELHLDRLSLSHVGGANSGTSYSFTQTGGKTVFRSMNLGTVTSPAAVSVEISGGEFLDDHQWHSSTVDQATFHVNGSGATTIDFTGNLTTTSNATLKFTIDSGGVTPIELNAGAGDSLAGTVDLDLSGAAPTNGATFTLFAADSGGDIYSGLSLDSADASDWSLQVNGNNLEAVYNGAPPPVTTMEVFATYRDQALKADGSTRHIYENTTRIGSRGSALENWVVVIPMELPNLNGGSIQSATLEVSFSGASTAADTNLDNIDLYGSTLYDYVGTVGDPQFFVDGENPTNPNATLLTDNILTHADVVADNFGWRVSADVSSYLSGFYASGAQPGAFVYFILTNDHAPTGGFQYIVYDTADGGNAPKLSLEVAGSQTVGTNYGTTSSITHNGVTWTFASPVTHGTFITGDYWVVGPVTITDISNSLNDPAYTPRAGQNGSMINPLSSGQDRSEQGYDDGIGSYNSALNVGRPGGNALSAGNPLTVPVDSTLISSVSWLYNSSSDFEPGTPSFNGGTGTPRPVTRAAGVLTVLESAPADYSFRPPYTGTDKTISHNLSDLDTSVLGSLAPVGSNVPDPAAVESQFAKPWIDHVFEYLGAFVHPSDHMENYGQHLAQDINEAALLLNMDYSQLSGSPDKQGLLIGFTQLGIDLAGIADNGGGWRANGGHGLGRKLPILMAGMLLDDQHMKDVGIWGQGDGLGNGGTEFQEFQNTFYVDQATIDLTQSGLNPNEGDWPSNHPSAAPGGQWEPDYRNVWDDDTQTVINEHTPYYQADLGLPEWGIRHSYRPKSDNGHLLANYRAINGSVYPGIALVVEILGANTLWNDDSFLDYADRYMDWTNGGNTSGNQLPQFVEDMWAAYRDDYGPVWPATGGGGAGTGQMLNVPVPADGKHYDSYAELEFVWPTNHGEGDVCLWKDDKHAALSITIDDNNVGDNSFWSSMSAQFGWKFTWFLIVHDSMWDVYNDVTGDNVGYAGDAYLDWKPMYDAGHDIQLHGSCGQLNSLSAQDYLTQSLLSLDHLESEIGNVISTYAYPCGDTGTNDEYKEALRGYLISARGTSGGSTPIHQCDFMETNSLGALKTYNGFLNATGVLRLEDKRNFDYSQWRGWGVMLYHNVDNAGTDEADIEAAFQAIKDNEHKYYVDTYTAVAQYAQQRLTATLTIDSVSTNEIRFTLVDEMNDQLFYQALTVKLRTNGWTGVSAMQDGLSVPAQLIQHEGNTYALVDAMPDGGQVIVSAQ